MRADEYDQLIEDPTGFLLNVWLPRVSTYICGPGEPATAESNLSLVKGGMAMMQYFSAFGPQIARLRTESGTPSAICGILKAPMDIIADKLRGYLGLVDDLFERRDKVVAACEALMPHLYHVGRIDRRSRTASSPSATGCIAAASPSFRPRFSRTSIGRP